MSDETTNLPALRDDRVALGTLASDSAAGLVDGASKMAGVLAQVIDRQQLYTAIQGRRYVRVEGWTTLATMLGCVPREVANVPQGDGSYVATVELVRMADGSVLSRATAECGSDEALWQGRPAYARRSMAATRATGKACRLAFSWIMALAGYEPTPAEEMDGVVPQQREPRREAPRDVTPRRGRRQEPQPAAPPAERVASEPQVKRFWALARGAAEQAGWNVADADGRIRAFLERQGIASSKAIPLDRYDEMVEGAVALFDEDPTA